MDFGYGYDFTPKPIPDANNANAPVYETGIAFTWPDNVFPPLGLFQQMHYLIQVLQQYHKH